MKAHEKEEFEKREKLLATLEKHPLTAQIKAEEAAAILEKRLAAAGEVAKLRQEEAELLPKLQNTLAEKEGIFLEAKRAMQAASDAFQKAKNELTAESFNFSNSIGRHEQTLIETAPEEIDQAILFFQEKLSWLRSPGRISRESISGERNIFTWKKTTVAATNAGAVRAAMDYCRAAIPALQEMKLWPELDPESIKKLKDGIPPIDQYEQFTGEGPLPKMVNPLMLLPSEESQNWSLNKLNEKVDKLLHPRRRV
jgi:hypothetical protein